MSLVDSLLLLKSPPVLCDQVLEVKEIVHNVYELPSLSHIKQMM